MSLNESVKAYMQKEPPKPQVIPQALKDITRPLLEKVSEEKAEAASRAVGIENPELNLIKV